MKPRTAIVAGVAAALVVMAWYEWAVLMPRSAAETSAGLFVASHAFTFIVGVPRAGVMSRMLSLLADALIHMIYKLAVSCYVFSNKSNTETRHFFKTCQISQYFHITL